MGDGVTGGRGVAGCGAQIIPLNMIVSLLQMIQNTGQDGVYII